MGAHTPKEFQRGRPNGRDQTEKRRAEILRAAVAHFARSGYAEAELNAVAADAGCAKGTLYNYFPSKCELFAAAVDQAMRELIDFIDIDSDDVVGRMAEVIRKFFGFFQEKPEYVELLIQERAAFRDRKKPSYLAYREANRNRWEPRFEAAMKRGEIREMPVGRALDVIGDLLYGTLFTNYFQGNPKTTDRQVRDVVDVLFHGLLTPEEARKRRESK